MSKYSLNISDTIGETKISVFELCVNGESLMADFISKIEYNDVLFAQFSKAVSIIENSCNLIRLNKSKFREIKGHSLDVKVYEAKASDIRIYLFHEELTGRVIVTGGIKKEQKSDIKSILKTIGDYRDERKKQIEK